MRTRKKIQLAVGATAVATAAAFSGVGGVAGAPARADAPGPIITFDTGESVTPCLQADPLTCPRDLSALTPEVWNVLVSTHSQLAVDLVYGSDFGPVGPGDRARTDGLAIIAKANQLGVPVTAWITAPISKGTFANEENAATMEAAVKSYASWKTTNALQIRQAELDMEIPLGDQPLADALQGDPSTLENAMSANISPAHQCQAEATYQDTITWAHQNGVTIVGTPVLFLLDDLQDGSTGLADALDAAPLLPTYDTLYLQAYRAIEGIDLGSGIVASYYHDMQQLYGAKGQVAIGSVGQAPYNTLAPIVNDVRMLAGLGATEIPIFDLDGAVKNFGAAGVQQIATAGQNPMTGSELAAATQMSPTGTAARTLFRTLDSFANGATLAVTSLQFHPRMPNAYPNGCS